jgi:hypothetical protein
MSTGTDFHSRLESKIRQQLHSQRVGFLLGAGTSFLNGAGYPLATQLWERIRDDLEAEDRAAIQRKLDDGADGLEHALDLLDTGSPSDSPYRHSVTTAVAACFAGLKPALETHSEFLKRLSRRTDPTIPIFCLNYDPLLERAAEAAKVRLTDGFVGAEQAFFEPAVFQEVSGVAHRGRTRHRQFRLISGVIQLLKLHGSLGWYESAPNDVRRCGFDVAIPLGTKRLMVPPQYRKATDTTAPPYATLWSEFRRLVRHGPSPVNRLVCIGYGMRDEHVNAVIDNGLARRDMTVVILAKRIEPHVFDRWSANQNVIVVTEGRCALYGEVGAGHPNLWAFEQLGRV